MAIVQFFYIQKMQILMLITNCYWSIFYTKVMWFTLNAGTTATEEAKKTPRIVHKIINNSSDVYLIEKVGNFSYI